MGETGGAGSAGNAAGTARARGGGSTAGMIFELLSTGRENARTARELAAICGTDRRSISLLVERERRAGKPICATSDGVTPGYYIAADRAEMEQYCDNLRHREREIAKTRRACAATIADLPDRSI